MSTKREIINTATTSEAVPMAGFADKPAKWLSQQMQAHKLKYLLAHTDDGVIWGQRDDKELITSHDVAPEHSPPLRMEMLQTARIFARSGELLVWRNETGEWAGRLITDTTSSDPGEWSEAFDEQQILWGTNAESRERGFALLSEGTQGILHVAPLNLSGQIDSQKRPVRLVVRHYLQADRYGFVQINASRLVTLLPEPKEAMYDYPEPLA